MLGKVIVFGSPAGDEHLRDSDYPFRIPTYMSGKIKQKDAERNKIAETARNSIEMEDDSNWTQ